MADDEYEILPHEEIANLKKQLKAYKEGPTSASRSSMENLSDSINNLLGLLKEASASMQLKDEEEDIVEKHVLPMVEKVDKVLEQNQKIAEGVVALADMINELKDEVEKIRKLAEEESKPAMPIRIRTEPSAPSPSPFPTPQQPGLRPMPPPPPLPR